MPDKHYVLTWVNGQGLVSAKCLCGAEMKTARDAAEHALEYRADVPPAHLARIRAELVRLPERR